MRFGVWCLLVLAGVESADSQIGQEVALAHHLVDGVEVRLSIPELLRHGAVVFCANWTDYDGGGRPSTKGTGHPLADSLQPLIGTRAWNRISGPDANSCSGCHNQPYGISGGSGDFVTNVFVLAQRFDFVTLDSDDKVSTKGSLDENLQPVTLQTVGNFRRTTGMFGAGYLEMLAREITADLQQIRSTIRRGETKELVAKGIHFGKLTLTTTGLWDTSKVEGLPRLSLLTKGSNDPPSLVIRPWHQAANVVSLREFTNNAFNQHHGIQSTERFGIDTDPDGDGVKNELTRADVTAVTLFQAALQVPGRVIPNEPIIEAAVLNGERVFETIGCSTCHIPSLPLSNWTFTEPNPYNPPGNLRLGETKTVSMDLASPVLPQPRLAPAAANAKVIQVPAYTDFKLHDITDPNDHDIEPLDMNQSVWSPKFKAGNRYFLTKRLWGAGNEPPYYHHGLFTTMRRSILAHAGEALQSRKAFEALPNYDKDSLIEFLKTLQVLPPATKDLVVDENFHAKIWPPPAEKRNQLLSERK
ncbi:MAG: thiol oxidoreductase [Terriglobia bacterium]|nr:MAG: thiol oxidoreductase [Terriglobia bacterium]